MQLRWLRAKAATWRWRSTWWVRATACLQHAAACFMARQTHASLWLLQVPEFLGAGARHFGFMLRGLKELQTKLQAAGIPFFLLRVSAHHAEQAPRHGACAGPEGPFFFPRCLSRATLRTRCPSWCQIWVLACWSLTTHHFGWADSGGARWVRCRGRWHSHLWHMVCSCKPACGKTVWCACVQVVARLPSGTPFHEVDAHNVVPVWVATDKREVR